MSEPGDAVQADDAPVIDTWPLFVTCGRGLESILVDELIRFGATDVKAGNGGVSGAIPAGTFSANRLEVDLAARTVALVGDARLRMVPGLLRMP